MSLGTTKFGRNTDVKYPTTFELPDDKTVQELLSQAFDLGIRLIDTAPAYGTSEERIGKLLPGDRTEWQLCTKAGEFYVDGCSEYDFSDKAIRTSVEGSLRALTTDYLDVLLIHSDGNDEFIINETDAIETLCRIKEQGLARSIGMSTKTVDGALAAIDLVDVLMVTLNPNDDSQLTVIEQANLNNKGILLKKIFDSGHSTQEDALKLALTTPGVTSAVVGTTNPEHLQDNVERALDVIEGSS